MNQPTLSERIRLRHARFDLILASSLGVGTLLVAALFSDPMSPDDRIVDPWAITLIVVAYMALVVRRSRPLLTLGITTGAVSAYLIATYPYGPILFAFFIAVYTVASLLPLQTAAIASGVALLVMITHVFVHPSALGGITGLIPGAAWAVVPFAIGTSVRASRATQDAARAEGVRQQLYEERIRLAQEVHDIVGHGLAAIQMQADVALHVDEQQSPRTRSALESISRASSEAFEELRSTLDVISEPRPSTRAATPGIEDVEALCRRMRAAGVRVDLLMTGDRRHVPVPIGLAIYRLVQESLTNVIRHGTTPEATVRIGFDEAVIGLRVTNPGPTASPGTFGHGIAGMRRRVTALGGVFDARSTPDGFLVEAEIPMEQH